MALLNGQTLCDEVAWRIQNRLAASGTGAGSIINYANDVLGLISSAGSWVFDQTSILNFDPTSGVITNMDVGKKISAFNFSTGTPVVRVDQDDYKSSSAGYVGTGNDFNTFRIQVDASGGTYAGTIQTFPNGNGINMLDIYYHLIPPTLVYGPSPTVRWTIQEMDDLLKDWTEAKVKQKLGMAGWDTLWADCLGRVKELRKMYTTERINTGPQDEAAGNMAEKNSVGRS